jgi:5-methylcytosine-specific restriction endonuclease McrA
MANRERTGRTNGQDKRGNPTDRRNRKLWLLSEKAPWGGNGEVVPCALGTQADCDMLVSYETMEVDRIVPGAEGGRYIRSNVRPTCVKCNKAAGFDTMREMAARRREMAVSTS